MQINIIQYYNVYVWITLSMVPLLIYQHHTHTHICKQIDINDQNSSIFIDHSQYEY